MGSISLNGAKAIYSAPASELFRIDGEPVTIVAANPARTMVVLVNDGDSDVYLGANSLTGLNQGIRLKSNGGVVQYGGPGGLPLTTGAIRGVNDNNLPGNPQADVSVQESI